MNNVVRKDEEQNSDEGEGGFCEISDVNSSSNSPCDASDSDADDELDANLEIDSPDPKPDSNPPSDSAKQELSIQAPQIPESLQELGGVLIYDSYAKTLGNDKLVAYYSEQTSINVDRYILFDKEHQNEIHQAHFNDKVREHDFKSDQDKHYFKNLTRFSPHRQYSNLPTELNVPQMQNILIFDSRFENGNLRKASKVNNVEYNLWLENDWNTKGHTQWYYFKVVYKDIPIAPEKKVHKVKFNILNLAKTTSLYQHGMMPCIWSKRKFEKDGTGWFRGGIDITYTKNDIPRFSESTQIGNVGNTFLYQQNGAGEGVETYFTFSFKYEFEPNQNDEVWFAHAVPYTYTRMSEMVKNSRDNEEYKNTLSVNMLCQTLGRNPVPVMTITSNIGSYIDYYDELSMRKLPGVVKKAYRHLIINSRKLLKQGQQATQKVQKLLDQAINENFKQFCDLHAEEFLQLGKSFENLLPKLLNYLKDHGMKKAIVFTSRVHPGEPQASHMLDGLLKYLLSSEAQELRDNFVFRIVPMLNPDGVIYGNYRCSLLGCDLNRKWDQPNRLLHPTIFYSKQMIRQMHVERRVIMYCDMHGHSRKQNAFFYGCCYKNFEQEGRVKNAQLRIIPLLCCQKNKLFSLNNCRFNIERIKESTARVVMFKEYNIMNSFTLECSFYGKEISDDSMMIKQQFDSTPMMRGCYSQQQLQVKKKRYEHMSIDDYQSLGNTMIETMNNYLPRQIHNLKFLGGHILQVFYEEFTKFVPAYILKREEERRLKEQEQVQPKKESNNKTQRKNNNFRNSAYDTKKQEESSVEKSIENLNEYSSGSETEFQEKVIENASKNKQMSDFQNFISDLKTQIKDQKDFFSTGEKGSSDGSSVEEEVPKRPKKKRPKKKEKQFIVKTQTKINDRPQMQKKRTEPTQDLQPPKKIKTAKTQVILADRITKKNEQPQYQYLKKQKEQQQQNSNQMQKQSSNNAAQRSSSFRQAPLTDEQVQAILLRHPNLREADQESIIKEITEYIQLNQKMGYISIDEHPQEPTKEIPSPIYSRHSRKLKDSFNFPHAQPQQQQPERRIREFTSIDQMKLMQKQNSQKFRQLAQPSGPSNAFYAHLMPKDNDQLISGISKVTHDKMGYDKPINHPIPSPGSPHHFSEDSEFNFTNVYYPQNSMLPQLVPQIMLNSVQSNTNKPQFNSSSPQKKMRQEQTNFSHSERKGAMDLQFQQKKLNSSLLIEEQKDGQVSSNTNQIKNNMSFNQVELQLQPESVPYPKQLPPFRIKKGQNTNLIGHSKKTKVLKEEYKAMQLVGFKNHIHIQQLGQLVDVPIENPIGNPQMQQEPQIESGPNPNNSFYNNTDERLKESPIDIKPQIHSNSVYQPSSKILGKNLADPMQVYQNEIKSQFQRNHFPSQEIDEHGFEQFQGMNQNEYQEGRMFPELKKRKIRQEIFKLHNYSATQEMLDKQRYLQVQLEKQQELLQEMKNQLHGAQEYQNHPSQRLRGHNQMKSVEPSNFEVRHNQSEPVRSPIKIDKSQSQRKQIVISSINYQPLPMKDRPTQRIDLQKMLVSSNQNNPYRQNMDQKNPNPPSTHLTPLNNQMIQNMTNSFALQERQVPQRQRFQHPSSQPVSKLTQIPANQTQLPIQPPPQHEYFNFQGQQRHSSIMKRQQVEPQSQQASSSVLANPNVEEQEPVSNNGTRNHSQQIVGHSRSMKVKQGKLVG